MLGWWSNGPRSRQEEEENKLDVLPYYVTILTQSIFLSAMEENAIGIRDNNKRALCLDKEHVRFSCCQPSNKGGNTWFVPVF
jgi:hypothetical protein